MFLKKFLKKILELSDTQVTLFSKSTKNVCDSNKFYENLKNKSFKHKFGKPNELEGKMQGSSKKSQQMDFKKFLIKNFKYKKIREKFWIVNWIL